MKLRRLHCFACLAAGLLLASAVQAQATTSRRTTADGRPLASSLPSKQVRRPQVQVLAFEQLRAHVGDFIELTTIHGVRREGHVESVDGQTLHLRVAAGAGYALVNVERGNIREIRIVR